MNIEFDKIIMVNKSYLKRCFLRALIFGSIIIILSCLAAVMIVIKLALLDVFILIFSLFLVLSIAGFIFQEKIENRDFTVRTVKMQSMILNQLSNVTDYQRIHSNLYHRRYARMKFNIFLNDQSNAQLEDVDKFRYGFDISTPSYHELFNVS